MSKLKFLDEMVAEMEARKRPLLAEKKALANAAARSLEIDALVSDIDEQLAEMKGKADSIRPVPPKEENNESH